MKIFAYIILFVMTCGIGYMVYILLHSFGIVRTTPRQDMFICPKGHGPISKDSLINFLGEDYCPICFHNKMRQAEKGQL